MWRRRACWPRARRRSRRHARVRVQAGGLCQLHERHRRAEAAGDLLRPTPGSRQERAALLLRALCLARDLQGLQHQRHRRAPPLQALRHHRGRQQLPHRPTTSFSVFTGATDGRHAIDVTDLLLPAIFPGHVPELLLPPTHLNFTCCPLLLYDLMPLRLLLL